jgi:hypothetical protein
MVPPMVVAELEAEMPAYAAAAAMTIAINVFRISHSPAVRVRC